MTLFDIKDKHIPYFWVLLGVALALPKDNYWPLFFLSLITIFTVYCITK